MSARAVQAPLALKYRVHLPPEGGSNSTESGSDCVPGTELPSVNSAVQQPSRRSACLRAPTSMTAKLGTPGIELPILTQSPPQTFEHPHQLTRGRKAPHSSLGIQTARLWQQSSCPTPCTPVHKRSMKTSWSLD